MIRFLIAIIVLVAGLILGTSLASHTGYVLVALDKTSYETTLTTAVVAVVLLFILIQIFEWLLIKLLRLNRATRRWLSLRGKRQAESSIAKGFIALATGEYKQAATLFSKGASSSASPMISYIAAAVAAKELGEPLKQAKYLELAQNFDLNNRVGMVPILVTQVKFQIESEQYQQAESTLAEIDELKINNMAVLRLKQLVFTKLGRWQQLQELLPELKKGLKFDEVEYLQLVELCYSGRFNDLAQNQDSAGLALLWNNLPRKDKKQQVVRLAIATAFIKAGDSAAAYQILGDLIASDPRSPYLQLLPKLELNDYYPVIEQMRYLFDKYENNIDLQTVFALLLVKANKWQEALPILQLVLAEQDSQELHLAAAISLERLGRFKEAVGHYRSAIVE